MLKQMQKSHKAAFESVDVQLLVEFTDLIEIRLHSYIIMISAVFF